MTLLFFICLSAVVGATARGLLFHEISTVKIIFRKEIDILLITQLCIINFAQPYKILIIAMSI
jgi:hypothetical protein